MPAIESPALASSSICELPPDVIASCDHVQVAELQRFQIELAELPTELLQGLHVHACEDFAVAAGVADTVQGVIEGRQITVNLRSDLNEDYRRRITQVSSLLSSKDEAVRQQAYADVLERRRVMMAELLIVEEVLQRKIN